MFKDTYEKKNKIQDLALLPPCKQTLTLHSRRANYIARVRKLCFRPVIDYDDITSHGWKENGQTVWTSEEFPNIVISYLYVLTPVFITSLDNLESKHLFSIKTVFPFITCKLSATTLKQAMFNACFLIKYCKRKPFSRDFTPVLGFIYSSLEQKAETWSVYYYRPYLR